MITLYCGAGSGDCEIVGEAVERHDEALMLNARQILRARGENSAVEFLERTPFRLYAGTNHFGDDFHVLVAEVPLQEYEHFRKIAGEPDTRRAFQQIATVLAEIGGPYIRFILAALRHRSPEPWDVFICHASEDKTGVVEPLYRHLDSAGIRCWYDRGEILWGDSIAGKINEGLRCSRFVIVVVSPALLQKSWARREMNAALSQEVDSGTTRLLPLMVGSDHEVSLMREQLAIQRDKRYLRWLGHPQEIESELRVLIRRENVKGSMQQSCCSEPGICTPQELMGEQENE
jgi:hypothetical protein